MEETNKIIIANTRLNRVILNAKFILLWKYIIVAVNKISAWIINKIINKNKKKNKMVIILFVIKIVKFFFKTTF